MYYFLGLCPTWTKWTVASGIDNYRTQLGYGDNRFIDFNRKQRFFKHVTSYNVPLLTSYSY